MIGKIYISGLIGSLEEERGVELIDVISQVKKQPDATSFEVYINSEGGVVDVGFDIYNYLISLGLPITTIGRGLVASIATVIFMAGQKRIVMPNTDFMIHLPMGGIQFATADEMELHTKSVRETENMVVKLYQSKLNLGKEAITPLLKNETWLDENQLLDLGFVTSKSEIKVAARAIIKRKPKLNKMSKNKGKFRAILNALIGDTVLKTIKTADQGELTFPDLSEDEVIDIGDRATLNGEPVGGTADEPTRIVGADGFVYLFVDSKLSEKIEDADEEEDIREDEMIEALAAILEASAQLDDRVGTLETETTAIKAERDDFKTKLEKAQNTIAKLKGGSKSPDTDSKDKPKEKTKSESAVAAWRRNKILKNAKK